MKLILKGFIIGIGKIMPGVSGAMLAITLNEYDKIIESIANIKTNTYEKIKYLSTIGTGIIIAIIITSKIIVKCLEKHYLATILLFEGIIIGGIPQIIKQIKLKKKDIFISIIIMIIVLIMLNLNMKQSKYIIKYNCFEFIKIIGIGIIDAISSIVPGISGTAILMYLGYYDIILSMFATITSTSLLLKNIFIALPFSIGFIIGTMVISKLINYLIKMNPNIVNIIVTIFMINTLIPLTIKALSTPTPLKEIIIGIILWITSTIISIKISNKK